MTIEKQPIHICMLCVKGRRMKYSGVCLQLRGVGSAFTIGAYYTYNDVGK
jgi:hypothetical protein